MRDVMYSLKKKKIKKRFSKKPFQIAFSLLISLLFTSVTFASVFYEININGYVSFGGYLDLDIVDFTLPDERPGEVVYAYGAGSTHDAIQMSLLLSFPGDERKVSFYIENVGSQYAVLGDWQTVSMPALEVAGAELIFPPTQGVSIAPGTKAGPFIFTIRWNPYFVSELQSGNYSFSANLTYH